MIGAGEDRIERERGGETRTREGAKDQDFTKDAILGQAIEMTRNIRERRREKEGGTGAETRNQGQSVNDQHNDASVRSSALSSGAGRVHLGEEEITWRMIWIEVLNCLDILRMWLKDKYRR